MSDDSIQAIAEEMISACKAVRQGDGEFTHEAVDDWAHRIMCFAYPVRQQNHSIEIFERLTKLQVGGCTCDTKTPELTYHDKRCTYRLAAEIEALLLDARGD